MIIRLCFFIVVFFAHISIPASATEDLIGKYNYSISPQYTYINNASSMLTISNEMATIKGSVQKTPSGKKINITCTLQKKTGASWSNLKSWSNSSSTTPSVYISKKYSVSKGEYRVKANYSVSGKSGTESGVVYSKTALCN